MNDTTSSLPFPNAAASPLPIERVWRNSGFWIATVTVTAVVMTLLEIGLVLAILGLLSNSETWSALKVGLTAVAILRLVFMLWKLASGYRRNSATFDAASVTFRKGADDASPVRIPFAKIDKITTWPGGAFAVQDPDGLIHSFNAYDFFKPARLAREISKRSGKRFIA